jgi:addiction module HigA family antidote
MQEFLIPMGVTQRDLATGIHVPYQRVNDLIHQRRGMTPSTALRLAKFLGTTPEFWMNLQLRCDLYAAKNSEKRAIESIRPHTRLHSPAGD